MPFGKPAYVYLHADAFRLFTIQIYLRALYLYTQFSEPTFFSEHKLLYKDECDFGL